MKTEPPVLYWQQVKEEQKRAALTGIMRGASQSSNLLHRRVPPRHAAGRAKGSNRWTASSGPEAAEIASRASDMTSGVVRLRRGRGGPETRVEGMCRKRGTSADHVARMGCDGTGTCIPCKPRASRHLRESYIADAGSGGVLSNIVGDNKDKSPPRLTHQPRP